MVQTSRINQIIDGLINHLFKSEDNRLLKKELEFVAMNREASGSKYDGFFFQGHYYTDLSNKLASKGLKSGIHPSLIPLMDMHIKDRKEVQFDKMRVKQALALVLKDCRTPQDIRDALPNSLADMIDQVRNLPRTRPEAFTLLSDTRKYNQYQKLRDKIEFYAAARMLY